MRRFHLICPYMKKLVSLLIWYGLKFLALSIDFRDNSVEKGEFCGAKKFVASFLVTRVSGEMIKKRDVLVITKLRKTRWNTLKL